MQKLFGEMKMTLKHLKDIMMALTNDKTHMIYSHTHSYLIKDVFFYCI